MSYGANMIQVVACYCYYRVPCILRCVMFVEGKYYHYIHILLLPYLSKTAIEKTSKRCKYSESENERQPEEDKCVEKNLVRECI